MELRPSEEGGACLRLHSEAAEDLGLECGSSSALQGAVGLTYHSRGPSWHGGWTGAVEGSPWETLRAAGFGTRPGLVWSELGPLDGDLHGWEEAGMVCMVMPPLSRCWGPAVRLLPSSWDL